MLGSGVLLSSGSLDIDTIQIAHEMTRMKAVSHTFAYFEPDDISQELWIAVNHASGKYDPTRSTPKPFFNVVTENAMKNLKRDSVGLTLCPDCEGIGDKWCRGCRGKGKVPRSWVVIDPYTIRDVDNSFTEEMAANELYEYILANISPKLQSPFKEMANGRNVSAYLKKKVREEVEEIMKEYRDDGR